jgi:hypothetical protein
VKRIVVMGQPGAFGQAWARRVARRLASRLDLCCVEAREAQHGPDLCAGWVTTAAIGEFSSAVLRCADTAIWLHFSPVAVARAWLRGLLGSDPQGRRIHAPRLADIGESLLHIAFTPRVHRLLRHPTLMHLQVFLLRNPEETDFWLHLQEQRLKLGTHRAFQPTWAGSQTR